MAKTRDSSNSTSDELLIPRLGAAAREAAFWLSTALAVVLAVALASFHPGDPSYTSTGIGPVHNLIGPAGAWASDFLLFILGATAYVLPLFLGYAGWLIFHGMVRRKVLVRSLRIFSLLAAIITCSILLTLLAAPGPAWFPAGIGGVLGDALAVPIADGVGVAGAALLLLAVLAATVTLATGLSWFALMDRLGALVLRFIEWVGLRRRHRRERRQARAGRTSRSVALERESARRATRGKLRVEPAIAKVTLSAKVERERQRNLFPLPPTKTGAPGTPPLALLNPPPRSGRGYGEKTLEAMSRQLELKLRDFGIEVEVVAVHAGPVITRFEVQPAPGVKVSQISGLAKDLARSLSAVSVRVVEVIPGKSVVGIEVPNEVRELVTLGEVLRSDAYDRSTSKLTLALGKDISGRPVVTDLARMPHLLIAGTTGSGKSVALNAMLLSLLYKASPDDVRLLLIDPKMLELSVYADIPHLLTPVVTDMGEAATALRWCVVEMDRRYRRIATLKVRSLANYNRKLRELTARGETVPDDPLSETNEAGEREPLRPMPAIVVVIDELADLMLVVGKKVEELIARLAQKARAAGIHLLVATQRPSVDVITGLIKANIPARIAFQVSSRVDSRTIIDQSGADSLLGTGDMLFLPPGTSLVNRVHGAFVDDIEVHRVVAWLKQAGEPTYLEEVLEANEEISNGFPKSKVSTDAEDDPLYDEAVHIVTETRRASISAVQRRLRIGYNRAARLIEQMERVGIVGSLQPNGNREVLAPPPPE